MFQKGARKKIYQSTFRVRSATNEDSPFFPRQPCGTRIHGVSVAKRVDVSGLLREFCKGWMSGKGCYGLMTEPKGNEGCEGNTRLHFSKYSRARGILSPFFGAPVTTGYFAFCYIIAGFDYAKRRPP